MTGCFMKKFTHPILIAAAFFLLAVFVTNDAGIRCLGVGLIWTLVALIELLEKP